MQNHDDIPKPADVAPSKEEREAAMFKAMGQIIRILEPFPSPARRRVLRGVYGFYELAMPDEAA